MVTIDSGLRVRYTVERLVKLLVRPDYETASVMRDDLRCQMAITVYEILRAKSVKSSENGKQSRRGISPSAQITTSPWSSRA